MGSIQLEAFGEPFTSEAAKMRFEIKDYECPFDSRISKCDKPNRGELRYGSCVAQVGSFKRIICPRRFYEGNCRILREIRNFIWGETPVEAYDEVKLQKKTPSGDSFFYGSIDWILVLRESIDASDFIGIEIQADATTGTGKFKKAINDLLSNNLQEHYEFGLNTLASFKGFLPQFIFKGQLFDDWKKPYVAVMQDELWNIFKSKFRIRYRKISNFSTETFLFFIYKLKQNSVTNKNELQLDGVFASRWIDFLFSFAVEDELLINYEEAKSIIMKKTNRYPPIAIF